MVIFYRVIRKQQIVIITHSFEYFQTVMLHCNTNINIIIAITVAHPEWKGVGLGLKYLSV